MMKNLELTKQTAEHLDEGCHYDFSGENYMFTTKKGEDDEVFYDYHETLAKLLYE